MATIRERISTKGEKTYYAEVRMKGYPPQRKTFSRKTDAQIWIGQLESDMRLKKNVKVDEGVNHTVSDLIDRYIEYELPHRKSDIEKFKMQLGWWKKQIGAYFLSAVTVSMLSECRDKLSVMHKRVPMKNKEAKITDEYISDATVNHYLRTMSIVFSYAVKDCGWLDDNPMLKVRKRKLDNCRVRYLDKKEINKLLKECYKISYELYLAVMIALSTGARYGEILNLKWQNIDFEHKQMYFMNTKNGTHRGNAITPTVEEELNTFKKIRNIKSDYLFTNKEGSGLLYIRGSFERALKNAGIQNFHFHDLRHTAASLLAGDVRCNLYEIGKILGHKSQQSTARYAHLVKSREDMLVNEKDSIIFKDITKVKTADN